MNFLVTCRNEASFVMARKEKRPSKSVCISIPQATIRGVLIKDGNGSGSDRVESPCTQNRNPKSKPESAPKTDSGGNPSPKPNPRIPETRTDTRNPNGYPKPADIYTHIHMYKQEATNNKYFHESTLNKFNNLSKQIIISIL